MYYVYVLQSAEQRLYIGYSNNLKRRIAEHNQHKVQTTKNSHYQLIYYEAYQNKADAVGREKFLKGGSGRKYLTKQLAHYFAENIALESCSGNHRRL